MFPEKTEYEDNLTLIMGSGIQFLDFALKLDLRKMQPGEFVRPQQGGPLVRLHFDERTNQHVHPAQPGRAVHPDFDVSPDESVQLLQGVWLPLPFFSFNPPRDFREGPTNWVRARIVQLVDGEDQDGHTHRVTIAFDTKVLPNRSDTAYLAPTEDDVAAGRGFALAHVATDIGWYLDQAWIESWLREVFSEQAQMPAFRKQQEDIDREMAERYHQAHYLNFLHLLGTLFPLPQVRVVSNLRGDQLKPIEVDMVLDVGNSRTCGILIEHHPQEQDGLSKRYELELRDLTKPEHVYPEPFESRLEFCQASFGKDHWSAQSGRSDAFQWPTIARVGREAARLASRRRGTEGSTGLSSPKRYLWDEDEYVSGWRFNCSYVKSEVEPHATALPVANLINELGKPLHTLPMEERMPVFHPHYTRNSMMCFMLSEVLCQALMQINSPSQRLRMSHSRVPRRLRSIILTMPPSMPKPEREFFGRAMEHAIGLVWKAMGWHSGESDDGDEAIRIHDESGRTAVWPYLPSVRVQWDEATCAQVVYLFNETQNNFAGRPEEFFATLARSDQPDRKSITVASIDIGGGTTDLVITDYQLDQGQGANVFIIPVQRFRDGFKIAGDDIVLDVIRKFVLPGLHAALRRIGVPSPEALLSRLCGSEPLAVQDEMLRQQLTLQVFHPIGLALLKAYENYDPLDPGGMVSGTFGDLIRRVAEGPTEDVLSHFNNAVRRELRSTDVGVFNILDTVLGVSLRSIHEAFLQPNQMNIGKSLMALAEIVDRYRCDVLLLTGRPSRLPGVQALFRKLLPLPPGRILSLHGYRTGGWYPFNKLGRVDDPKTTAAVGAMLCLLSGSQRLPNFFFRAAAFKPYSTIKHVGMIDNNNVIADSSIYYENIDLDNPDYSLPERSFDLRGTMRLGYRQLDSERWSASPLYVLTIENPRVREEVSGKGRFLRVRLKVLPSRNRQDGSENIALAGVEYQDGGQISLSSVRLRLNTLSEAVVGDSNYWLDSGSVYRH